MAKPVDSGRLGSCMLQCTCCWRKVFKEKGFLSNKLNPRKWKNNNLFPFRFQGEIKYCSLFETEMYKKNNSSQWRIKDQVCHPSENGYSDFWIFRWGGEGEKRCQKYDYPPLCVTCQKSHFISILLFHILPSGTFSHGNNFGLVRYPDSKKAFSNKISDHKCNVSRVENLGNLIQRIIKEKS